MASDKEVYDKEIKTKDDVRKNIGKASTYLTKLKKIKSGGSNPVVNPLAEKPKTRILTNTALDRMLSRVGGIEEGSTAELYGEFATGKTQVCFALAAEALVDGLVVYIDSEHTFRGDRFREVCEARGIDADEVSSRLMLYQPNDWIDQESITLTLPEYDDDNSFLPVKLIIVDSLMKHWASSSDFYGRENLTNRQQLVREQLERLARYARRHGSVFLFTNQVYDKPVDTMFAPLESKVGSRGGKTVEHFGDYRIFLRKGYGNMRFARLVDSPDLPLLEVPFLLEESGILDIVDDAERAKAVMLSAGYAEKFLSGRAGAQAAGKQYLAKALELGYLDREKAIEQGLSEKDADKALEAQAKTMDDRINEAMEYAQEVESVLEETEDEDE